MIAKGSFTKTAPCASRGVSYHRQLLVWLCGAANTITPRAARMKEFHFGSQDSSGPSRRQEAPLLPRGRRCRFIEQVGRYNPLTNPKIIDIDLEKVDAWIVKGAQPTSAVSHLIDIVRSGAPAPEKKQKLSKKAAAKKAAAENAA